MEASRRVSNGSAAVLLAAIRLARPTMRLDEALRDGLAVLSASPSSATVGNTKRPQTAWLSGKKAHYRARWHLASRRYHRSIASACRVAGRDTVRMLGSARLSAIGRPPIRRWTSERLSADPNNAGLVESENRRPIGDGLGGGDLVVDPAALLMQKPLDAFFGRPCWNNDLEWVAWANRDPHRLGAVSRATGRQPSGR